MVEVELEVGELGQQLAPHSDRMEMFLQKRALEKLVEEVLERPLEEVEIDHMEALDQQLEPRPVPPLDTTGPLPPLVHIE